MLYLLPEIVLCALGCLGLVLACFPTRSRVTGYAVAGAVVCLLAAVGAAVLAHQAWAAPREELLRSLPIYVRHTFAMDAYSRAFAALALIICGISFLFSLEYVRDRLRDHEFEFLSLIAFASLGVSCLASGKDLLTVWFSLELLSVTGYIMAAFLRAEERSIEAALKYFLLGATSSAVMLFGFSYIYGATGSLQLAEIGELLRNEDVGPVIPAAALMALVGFGFKIAMVPFHMWCPDVYEGAPTPVTAFLSVGPKLAGFAALARVLLVAFGTGTAFLAWEAVLTVLAAATMCLGNLVALRQTNLKRLLAYSSIAHAGYMLCAILVLRTSEWALSSLVLYALAYAFMNLGAFAVVIGFSNTSGDDRLPAYEGLSQRAPYLAFAWVVFALSLVGIPPTAGFVGKLYILIALVDADLLWLAILVIVNSMVSLYFYFEVARRMYFRPPAREGEIRVGGGAGVAIGLALAGTLLLIVFAQPIAEAVKAVAAL